MDSIGAIKSTENWTGGRKYDQGKRNSVPGRSRGEAAPQQRAAAAAEHELTQCGTALGQKVDTTA